MKRLDGIERESITIEQSKKIFEKFGDDIIQQEMIEVGNILFQELKLNLVEQFDNHGYERYGAKKKTDLELRKKW